MDARCKRQTECFALYTETFASCGRAYRLRIHAARRPCAGAACCCQAAMQRGQNGERGASSPGRLTRISAEARRERRREVCAGSRSLAGALPFHFCCRLRSRCWRRGSAGCAGYRWCRPHATPYAQHACRRYRRHRLRRAGDAARRSPWNPQGLRGFHGWTRCCARAA